MLELALAGDHIGQVQARELVLAWLGRVNQAAFAQVVEQPVVEGALIFKLQRADGVGDVLQRVLNRVREGVHRVDAPLVAGVVVLCMAHAVDSGVTQVDVGRSHVDLGAQHGSAIGQQAGLHVGKALQVFGHAAIAEGAVDAGTGEVAAVGLHVVGRLLVHVGQALLDQVDRTAVHEVEVVAGEVQVVAAAGIFPVKAQPFDGIDDAVYIFLLFLFRIGIVKAQVADAAVVAGQTKVQADGLGMTNVQIAIGLRGEAGTDLGLIDLTALVVLGITGRTAPVAGGIGAFVQIGFNDLAQKVGGLDRLRGGVGGFGGVNRAHCTILGWLP